MPVKTVFKGEIKYIQILDEKGKLDKKQGIPKGLTKEDLVKAYEWMVYMRLFDEKALLLQRTGRLGTYLCLTGQEAAQVGAGLALTEKDWLVPSFREHGLMMMKGVPGYRILAYWGGDERGSSFDKNIRSLPISVPVASQLTHAAGLAMATAYKGEKAAVLACVGDGGTSEGDFHDSCNFAGVFKAPLVILIQNNQWAISVPRKKQTASETLAQKALAYGIRGVQVDGNDVLGVYSVVREALELAREKRVPTVVEAITYRMKDHSTADDAKKYRDPEEEKEWQKKDPITRLEKFLLSEGELDQNKIEEIHRRAKERVEEDVKARDAMGEPDPLDAFRHLYGEIPPHLKLEMEELKKYL